MGSQCDVQVPSCRRGTRPSRCWELQVPVSPALLQELPSAEPYLTQGHAPSDNSPHPGQVGGRVWGYSEGPSQLHIITGLAEASAGSESVVHLPPCRHPSSLSPQRCCS